MMSKRQMSRLRHGDVVLWGRWPNLTFRTVIEGPADIARMRGGDPMDHLHVVFAIRRRSWTGRAKTGYGWNDVKHLIRATKKRRRTVMSAEELERLKKIRFNPKKEYAREIREQRGHILNRGWRCPFKPLPLPK